MATITEAFVLEHSVLCQMFDEIERILAGSPSAQEVKRLASLVEALLSHHGEHENNLAGSVLNHVLVERGALLPLYQDHNEISGHFPRVHRTSDSAKASRLLHKALSATRKHFKLVEQTLFPILEKTLQPDTLLVLGSQWRK